MFTIFWVNLGFVIGSFAKIAETESSELSQAPLSELIFGSWDYATIEEEMADVMKSDISGLVYDKEPLTFLIVIKIR